MLNIVNLALAIATSFAMAIALSFAAYNYWQDSQIEKKLKSSESEFENAKISIEKDHVQAVEALNGFNKKLEESEKQIVEAVTEFKKKKKEELSDADQKTKRSEPPKLIKPELSATIQRKQKDEGSSTESGSDKNDNNSSISSENIEFTNQKRKQNTSNILEEPAQNKGKPSNLKSTEDRDSHSEEEAHCLKIPDQSSRHQHQRIKGSFPNKNGEESDFDLIETENNDEFAQNQDQKLSGDNHNASKSYDKNTIKSESTASIKSNFSAEEDQEDENHYFIGNLEEEEEEDE